ncbi:MAG: hypothetical protein PF448_02535 [Bacteroidales bacterium]|jgi:hypothetical protein|nr:hypothetical protein [Bacteroidales bacterium]
MKENTIVFSSLLTDEMHKGYESYFPFSLENTLRPGGCGLSYACNLCGFVQIQDGDQRKPVLKQTQTHKLRV